jgi:Leucine-rich repeat (LRR) protein
MKLVTYLLDEADEGHSNEGSQEPGTHASLAYFSSNGKNILSSLFKRKYRCLSIDLKEVDIAGHGLDNLAGLAELCPNLTRLDASRNALQTLANLPPCLDHLSVRNNSLTESLCIGYLDSLSYIDVSSNKISSLDQLLLPSIQILIADGNNITEVRPIETCTQLRHLSLRGNLINTWSRVGIPPSVEELDLGDNLLDTLIFGPYSGLRRFYIGNEFCTRIELTL